MATWQAILNKRIRAAKHRLSIGKAKPRDSRLLAKQDAREQRQRDDAERRAAFEHAISKE